MTDLGDGSVLRFCAKPWLNGLRGIDPVNASPVLNGRTYDAREFFTAVRRVVDILVTRQEDVFTRRVE